MKVFLYGKMLSTLKEEYQWKKNGMYCTLIQAMKTK